MSEHLKPLKPVIPIIEQYALTVVIPMEEKLAIVKGQSIIDVRDRLVLERRSVTNDQRHVELGVIITVLTYAASRGATLDRMYNSNHKLKISLSFTDFESFMDFRDALTFTR